MSHLRVDDADGIRTITFDRPEVKNALTVAMRREFCEVVDAADTTTRQAYELVSQGFGPGANGPLLLAATRADDQERDAMGALATQLRELQADVLAQAQIYRGDFRSAAAGNREAAHMSQRNVELLIGRLLTCVYQATAQSGPVTRAPAGRSIPSRRWRSTVSDVPEGTALSVRSRGRVTSVS